MNPDKKLPQTQNLKNSGCKYHNNLKNGGKNNPFIYFFILLVQLILCHPIHILNLNVILALIVKLLRLFFQMGEIAGGGQTIDILVRLSDV